MSRTSAPNMRTPAHTAMPASAWLIALLLLLFAGPPAAALFQATRLPPLAGTGALASELLGRYICPTPAKAYMLLGWPMAVCARCWGATIGLWLAWLLWRLPARAAYHALNWPARAGLGLGALLLWALEIALWPGAPLWALLLNGVSGGLWAALLLGSVAAAWGARRHPR